MTHLLALLLSTAAMASPQTNISDYINLQYRAENAVQDFDHELDLAAAKGKDHFLERSRAYKDVIALRQLLEITKEKIARDVRRAAGRRDIRHRLATATPAEKLALAHLEIAGLAPVFSSPAEYVAFENRFAAEVSAERAKFANAFESEIRAELDSLGLAEEDATTGKIEPGTGANGNVSGYGFPAKTWALTYDDGPSSTLSIPMLNNLKKYGKHATYFQLAQNLLANTSVIADQQAAGMPLNNHSYTHANLPKVSDAVLRHEIIDSTALDTKVFGYKPRFFRTPYGAGLNVARVRRMIADNGMIHVFWNVDSLDWQDKNPASILARVQKEMGVEKKGVILMHDIHAQTVEASRLLMEYSKSLEGKPEALRWVTLPQIVDELNAKP